MGTAGTGLLARETEGGCTVHLRPEDRSASDVPAILPHGHEEQPADHRASDDVRGQEGRNACPDRAGMVDGAGSRGLFRSLARATWITCARTWARSMSNSRQRTFARSRRPSPGSRSMVAAWMRRRWRRLAKIDRSIVSETCPATPVRAQRHGGNCNHHEYIARGSLCDGGPASRNGVMQQ